MLDPIHNQGLRLALGAFRTSPVASLYVEADEPSHLAQVLMKSKARSIALAHCYSMKFAILPIYIY